MTDTSPAVIEALLQGAEWQEPENLRRYLFPTFEALSAERDALAAQVTALREALGFYADVSDYVAPLTGGMGKLWNDCGETARAALQVDAGPAPGNGADDGE